MRLIIISIVSFFLLVGCSDSFLEVKPTTQTPMEEYYDTEEKILKGLMAAYGPLQWPDYVFDQYNPLPFLSDVMSDDVRVGGANAYDVPHLQKMRFFSATPDYTSSSLWVAFYSGVYRSNLVIANIDNVKNISKKNKDRIYAEALTLRAYYYTWLWKLWGNIPYYTTNPTPPSYLVDQKSANEVYSLILHDLDLALADNKLALVQPTDKLGRWTRAAVQMLRANVVMYQQDEARYTSVLSDMQEIIGTGTYKLYKKFGAIWEDEGEWCSESIFEINYTDSPSNRTWERSFSAGGTIFPTFIGINALESSCYDGGGYGFSPVEESLYNLYEDADSRKDGGILNFERHKLEYPKAKYKPRYDDTGYFNKKYQPRANGNDKYVGDSPDMNFRNNYRVYRFSETLLIASELLVRTGGSAVDADKYLNMVRARAYEMDIDAASFATKKKQATLDNILLENRLEFACEGHRFWDLVRFGKAEQVLGARGYAPNKKYLPIPQSEIDQAQGTLKQNAY